MPGEIEAEHLLLRGEQLLTRPLRHLRARVARGRSGRRRLGPGKPVEERGLTLLAIALAPLPGFHGLVEAGEEAGAAEAQGVEGARLDEALHHPAIDQAQIDTRAEVSEGGDGAVLL